MNEHILNIHLNIWGAVAFALLAVVIGTRVRDVGVRNYLFILISASLGSASVVEQWFFQSSFLTCCLIGFGFGYLADDVLMNLNATLPEFIKTAVNDFLDWLREWLRRVTNRK